MAVALVHLALLAYTLAAAAYLAWLVKPRERLVPAGRWLLGGGLVFHLAAFPAILGTPGAAWTAGHLFSLVAAATVAAYLLLDWRFRVPVAGAFAAPLTVAAMVPAHLVASRARDFTGNAIALPIHVAAAVGGTVAISLAFVLALLWLSAEKRLKRKQAGWLLARLPSLELIERLGWQLSVWGFIFLSAVIATGALVTADAPADAFPFAVKQAFALLAWALLAVLIQARLVAGWRGRRLAVLVVVGFLLLVGSYVGLLTRRQPPPPAAHAEARL